MTTGCGAGRTAGSARGSVAGDSFDSRELALHTMAVGQRRHRGDRHAGLQANHLAFRRPLLSEFHHRRIGTPPNKVVFRSPLALKFDNTSASSRDSRHPTIWTAYQSSNDLTEGRVWNGNKAVLVHVICRQL